MRGDRHLTDGAAARDQRGAALILVVVGMVAILGVVGLALDSGHAMLNKTRLQNAVDAAALAAAKTLDQTADVALADAAADAMFALNAGNAGNREIGESLRARRHHRHRRVLEHVEPVHAGLGAGRVCRAFARRASRCRRGSAPSSASPARAPRPPR